MFVEKIYSEVASRIKNYPVHVNRASAIGGKCERELFYSRTRWQDKQLHDVGLQLIFDEGNEQEVSVIKKLLAAGVQIKEQQRAFSIPDLKITGHQDLEVLGDDGIWYPCEIKSMSPHIFQAVNEYSDFFKLADKYPWLAKYPAQIQLYMYGNQSDKTRGVFILKDKSSGALKEIWCDLDFDYLDGILKKAKRINEHVDLGIEPERYISDYCERCPFKHICLPDRDMGDGVKVLTSEESAKIDEVLSRMEELKECSDEYKALDKTKKMLLSGIESATTGKFYISGSFYTRKSYNVPDEIKKEYIEEKQYWKSKVIKL